MRMLPFFKPKKGFQLAGSGDGGGGGGGTSAFANKTDLTAIILTGTTNTSGNVISAGTWFYLNGTPCIAKVDIASGATFTEGTNYEEKTIGSALSELNGKLASHDFGTIVDISSYTSSENVYTCPSDGYVRLGIAKNGRALVNINGINIAGADDDIMTQGYMTLIFVKKGFRVYFIHSDGIANLKFIPLVSGN